MSQAPSAPADRPPARKRPRGFETAGDMVRSVVVVMGLVLVIYFLGVRPQVEQRPPVDVAGVTEQARQGGVAVAEPVLPEGWAPSNARFGPDAEEGLPTLHLGYLDPQGQYGGISATPATTPTWVQGVAGEPAVEDGTRDLAGRTWQVWTNDQTRGTTLVSSPTSGQGPALAVTSRGSDQALTELATAAVTATDPAASTAGS
ncbi:DUF4245 family protein [Quadrisphaera sp. INWT6]|uniref:DUF4245 family protein n=1 Tax=Quadrisphaera sp. INWT6 TaxID=2596917 RepID=UPI0018927185|nr:DUF4245 family protein [Quadrisphaera sp. INWT6]MBF5080434.1 DUF4245 domain-containing protein [Quadrisphaera sp. INWT6]